jgi:hypothetical protein
MSRRTVAASIALMVVCASFVVVITAPASQAAFPSMSEGDKWALKGEKDLALSYSSLNDLFTLGTPDNWFRNITIAGAGFSGYVGSAAVFEVVDVTASEYVIKVTAAQNLSLAALFSLEGDMAVPGTYIYEWYPNSLNPDNLKNTSEATTTHGAMGLDADLVVGANETVTFHVQKSTMAVRSVEMYMSAYARGHLDVTNYPNTSTDWDVVNMRDLIDITDYETFKSTISLDLNLTGEASFDPYLEIVKDSPAQGSTWTQDTYVNGTFNWNGMFDVTGLPTNITDMLFGPGSEEWGVAGFPIDLAAIYNPDSSGPQIDNGTLALSAAMIDPTFANNGNRTVNETAFGSVLVNELAVVIGGSSDYLTFLYYPAKGYIVGTEILLPLSQGMSISLTMSSVPVEEAKDMVDAVAEQVSADASYEAVNSWSTPGKAFVFPLDLMIILVVVATSLVVMLGYVYVKVYMRRPKEKV